MPSCSEGLGFCACFLFFFAGGFHYKYSLCNISLIDTKISYKKKQWRPPSKKEERRKKPKPEE
jgi:hypothetical protein